MIFRRLVLWCFRWDPAGVAIPGTSHLQGSREPEQCVHAADDKRHDQQRCHAPEGPEKKRILLRIVMGCVRQIPGKSAIRTGMALLARLHHILPAQVGARIGDRENIVRTMAVVALCRLGVPELRNLPVVRVEVGRRDCLVAPAALAHDGELESLFVGTTDGMRAVTVVAHGKLFVRCADSGRVDTLSELFLYSMMATPARCGHVFRINAGVGVLAGELAMSRVTARTHCSHGQTAAAQTLAMDAFLIVLDDVRLIARDADGRLLTFAVAPPAQGGDIRGKCN